MRTHQAFPMGCLAFGLCLLLVMPADHAAQAEQPSPPSFSQLVQKAKPSVVNISTAKDARGESQVSSPFGFEDPYRGIFERFFGGEIPNDYNEGGLGTGFIIDEEGHILTNNHVIEGADEIKVTLDNKEEHIARVIGRDAKTDLALVKIKPDSDLTPLPLGDSAELEAGDWVVAIGNPFGLGNTVTAGIVSAEYRHLGTGPYESFIQIDASINPGNSGGPLLNTSGEAIGINSAIFSQSGASVGIGFAIPINTAKQLLPQLKGGKVVRGWLGALTQGLTPQIESKLGLNVDQGALVGYVVPGGPAEKAGIRRGDVIVSFDGREVREHSELPLLIAVTPVGKAVTVVVLRKEQRMDFDVTIGELAELQEPRQASGAKPNLGLTVQEITPELANAYGLTEKTGIMVIDVEEDSAGAEARIQPGDIVLEVDETPMRTGQQFGKKLDTYEPGETILFLIEREQVTLYVTLTVRERRRVAPREGKFSPWGRTRGFA